MANFPEIVIPADLLPVDGRFGAGPSKVRPEQIQALVEKSVSVMGTSHRQKPVKNEVAALRAGLAQMFTLPAGYEVVIGTGGRLPPTQIIDNDGFGTYDPDQDGIDFWESLEGMYVSVAAPRAISNTNGFGETYVVASNGAGATGNDLDDEGNGATGDDVHDDGNGATGIDLDDDGDGATGDDDDNDEDNDDNDIDDDNDDE